MRIKEIEIDFTDQIRQLKASSCGCNDNCGCKKNDCGCGDHCEDSCECDCHNN